MRTGENVHIVMSRATERYRRNTIPSLTLDDGRIVEDQADKAVAFYSCFKNRMGVSTELIYDFDMAEISQRVPSLKILSAPFSQAEIDWVIKIISVHPALGPDGFNGQFLNVCWKIIAPDFYELCSDFWEGKISLDCLNNSLITLIPKKLTPKKVNDFRPISLLNCVLKVLTKILAERLQSWILKVVHRNRYGFIKSIKDSMEDGSCG